MLSYYLPRPQRNGAIIILAELTKRMKQLPAVGCPDCGDLDAIVDLIEES